MSSLTSRNPDHVAFHTEELESASKIIYKAQYLPGFFEGWQRSNLPRQNRKYFYVLDNGLEFNNPTLFPWIFVVGGAVAQSICLPLMSYCFCCSPLLVYEVVPSIFACTSGMLKLGLCDCIEPNLICPLEDSVTKMYFDSGLGFGSDYLCLADGKKNVNGGGKGSSWVSWAVGFCPMFPMCAGTPTAFRLNDDLVCCCCLNCNACGFVDYCCGDMVALNRVETVCGKDNVVTPCRTCTLCCANPLDPCGCCCSSKNGSPLICFPLATGLKPGQAAGLASAINESLNGFQERSQLLTGEATTDPVSRYSYKGSRNLGGGKGDRGGGGGGNGGGDGTVDSDDELPRQHSSGSGRGRGSTKEIKAPLTTRNTSLKTSLL